jgi:membrane protease YdiL (CAAX protease family)
MVQQETSSHNHSIRQRIIAVLDVLVVFLATFTLIWLMALLPIGKIEWMFLVYVVMIAFPLLIMVVTRRDLKAYGLGFHRLRDQLDMILGVFPVAAIEGAIAGWLLPELVPNAIIRWEGALILSLTAPVFFVWIAWILRRKPTTALVFPALLFIFPLAGGNAIVPERLVSFLFYLVFLGPGEEFLFRGYIQSRLNAAFGRPFRFWGVSWGWGLVIASLLFGFMHVLNPFNPFLGEFELYGWWGVWTVFGGLTKGYVREKAGSILPPALLHGLPQAIASLFLGFFAVR